MARGYEGVSASHARILVRTSALLEVYQELINSLSHAAMELGLSLFPLFALALDLPEDFFADKA